MNVVIENVINKIIQIPHDFNRFQDKSKYTLVFESAYFEVHDQISEDDIIEIVKKAVLDCRMAPMVKRPTFFSHYIFH